MSIAVLTQVYDEMRRLAIAGSMVAKGDFRLKKLIPTLDQIGAKSPVFARVGEAAKAVVEGEEKNSAQALLELTTLVNAILYTQGETGLAGALEPIETIDLGSSNTQASARVLKPLLEALGSTGSGRLEVIRDAYERGAFRDIRLVKPALTAIDDVYAEIGDFMAAMVLPLFGKAILPELRAAFDAKGKGGHSRRLRLMHALDPVATRDLVKHALEGGSKEVKVVAIECLGGDADDLSFLIEQASGKALEVRQAAYHALATIEDDAAVAVLQKAVDGNDLNLAVESLQKCRSPKLVKHVIATAETKLATLRKTKDKKDAGQLIQRLISLLQCLSGRADAASAAFVLGIFAAREDWAKVKGDIVSGSELNSAVVGLLEQGTEAMRATLVENHGGLSAEDLALCFQAALRTLSPEKVFAIFSPYVTATVDKKKKQSDAISGKRDTILNVIARTSQRNLALVRCNAEETWQPLDPRWLDVAVDIKDLALLRLLIRPGHAGANALLTKVFGERLKKAKYFRDCHEMVACMIDGAHPEATDAFVAVLEKFGKKADYFGFAHLVVELPKSALPRIEALIPHLNDRVADSLLGYLQPLREKP